MSMIMGFLSKKEWIAKGHGNYGYKDVIGFYSFGGRPIVAEGNTFSAQEIMLGRRNAPSI